MSDVLDSISHLAAHSASSPALGEDAHYRTDTKAGTYRLTTTSEDGELVAWTDGLNLGAGEVRQLSIVLELAQPITGVVRARDGAPVRGRVVAIHRASGRETETVLDGDGRFSVEQIPAGEYEVKVHSSMRPRVFPSVNAPGHLSVDVERQAVLRGRVAGFTTCGEGSSSVEVQRGGEDTEAFPLDDDCTFTGFLAMPAGEARLTATVGGRELVHTLHIPESGDPAPVCLGGPCTGVPGALLVRPLLASSGHAENAHVMVGASDGSWGTREFAGRATPLLVKLPGPGAYEVMALWPPNLLARTVVHSGGEITELAMPMHALDEAAFERVIEEAGGTRFGR